MDGYIGLAPLCANRKLTAWIKELRAEGRQPSWTIVHECDPSDLDRLEITYIAEFRDAGHPLLNLQPGGRGMFGRTPKEKRTQPGGGSKAISEKAKARWSDPEYRERMREKARQAHLRHIKTFPEEKPRETEEQRKARAELILRGYGWLLEDKKKRALR